MFLEHCEACVWDYRKPERCDFKLMNALSEVLVSVYPRQKTGDGLKFWKMYHTIFDLYLETCNELTFVDAIIDFFCIFVSLSRKQLRRFVFLQYTFKTGKHFGSNSLHQIA